MFLTPIDKYYGFRASNKIRQTKMMECRGTGGGGNASMKQPLKPESPGNTPFKVRVRATPCARQDELIPFRLLFLHALYNMYIPA